MNIKSSRLKRTRIPTDKEICDMLKREDYYLILKIKKNPDSRQGIVWNVMRTKWSILNQFGKL